jgi:Tol biopolymer transport system component
MKWPRGSRSRASVAFALALLVAVAALVLAACGGSGATASSSSSAATSPTTVSTQAASPLPTPTVSGTIAFCKVVKPEHGGDADIYLVRAGGTGLKRLTDSPCWEGYPSWSPGGTKIAYERYRQNETDGEFSSVWVMNADGSGQRRLTSLACGSPSWSPDGTKIAYVRFSPTSAMDVFVMNADGSRRRAVVRGPEDDGNPVWTSDGRIVFKRGERDLYVVDLDGTGLKRLLSDGELGGYAVSPDGRSLAYNDYGADLVLLGRLHGSSEPLVILTQTSDYVPEDRAAVSWRQGGKVLAIASYGPGGINGSPLYVVSADGIGLSAVPGIERAMDPAWRPR